MALCMPGMHRFLSHFKTIFTSSICFYLFGAFSLSIIMRVQYMKIYLFAVKTIIKKASQDLSSWKNAAFFCLHI